VELVEEVKTHGWSPEELAYQHPHLTLGQVHAALAYYWDHQEEIEAEIRRGEALVEEIRREVGQHWSAVAIAASGQHLVIYNPMKSTGRIASDVTHELAHLILSHEPGRLILSQDGEIVMRSFDQKQEDAPRAPRRAPGAARAKR
jgi:hypothetical protein